MPRYTYKCSICKSYFETSHSIFEKLTECQCGADSSLKRVPSIPFRVSIKDGNQKAGQVVKEFIEDARKEIAESKRRMKDEIDDF